MPKTIVCEQTDPPYQIVNAPDNLDSGGFSACIVITLMYKQRAFMTHSPLLHYEGSNETHDFFEMIDKEIPMEVRKDLVVVVAGSLIEPDEDPRNIKASMEARGFTFRHLDRLGFKKIDIRWCPDGCGLRIMVDTRARVVHVETSTIKNRKLVILSVEQIRLP
jgi:hypothetical protein